MNIKPLQKIIITAATIVLSFGGSLAVAAPAFASVQVCTRFPNSSGNKLCIATADLSDGTAVTGNSASNIRGITLQSQHFTNQHREVYRLVIDGTSGNRCVGLSSAGKATIRDCLGNQNFTNWQAEINGDDGSVLWINNSFANPPTCGASGCILSSDGTGGDQLFATNAAQSGTFQKWTPIP